MLTIRPRRACRIPGSTSCAIRTAPNTFVSNSSRSWSMDTASIAPLTA
jgi:hypothetical protein